MSKKLVRSFNALPRRPLFSSGLVTNTWHFDVRYVHLEPTPSHILFLIQPTSEFAHLERLPIGLPPHSSGIRFFPETAEEAAPEVAKAVMRAFTTRFGGQLDSATAPWKLTTEDGGLAKAVGDEFRRLGVGYEALLTVGLSSRSVTTRTHEVFRELFFALKKSVGYKEHIAVFISTPLPIVFSPAVSSGNEGGRDEGRAFELALKYVQELQRCRPPVDDDDLNPKERVDKLTQEMEEIQLVIEQKPEQVVKSEADDGDPDSALDYGLRLQFGFGAPLNRALSRKYFIKALQSPLASSTLKSTIHSLLINWHTNTSPTDCHARHLFAAAHHANLATSLGRPSSIPASPAVLWFMKTMLEPYSQQAPEVCLFWKDCWRAWEERVKQMEGEQGRMDKKRLKRPNRYRCAAVGCEIEADSGRMLSQCSGKCDPDKKPSYCGRECQRADWKNHKPFCKPGAACSVLDAWSGTPRGVSKQNALQIPITMADGKTILVSSSTMDANELKELKDAAERDGPRLVTSSMTVEIVKLDAEEEGG